MYSMWFWALSLGRQGRGQSGGDELVDRVRQGEEENKRKGDEPVDLFIVGL